MGNPRMAIDFETRSNSLIAIGELAYAKSILAGALGESIEKENNCTTYQKNNGVSWGEIESDA